MTGKKIRTAEVRIMRLAAVIYLMAGRSPPTIGRLVDYTILKEVLSEAGKAK